MQLELPVSDKPPTLVQHPKLAEGFGSFWWGCGMQELVVGQSVVASRAALLRRSRGARPTAGVRPAVLREAAPCTVALCLAVP